MYPKGVSLAQIESVGKSYPNENEVLQGCNVVSGYNAKKGVIKAKSAENAETPLVISEEEIESHIIGFVLIEH